MKKVGEWIKQHKLQHRSISFESGVPTKKTEEKNKPPISNKDPKLLLTSNLEQQEALLKLDNTLSAKLEEKKLVRVNSADPYTSNSNLYGMYSQSVKVPSTPSKNKVLKELDQDSILKILSNKTKSQEIKSKITEDIKVIEVLEVSLLTKELELNGGTTIYSTSSSTTSWTDSTLINKTTECIDELQKLKELSKAVTGSTLNTFINKASTYRATTYPELNELEELLSKTMYVDFTGENTDSNTETTI
jgi:hypothetical protein